MANDPNLKKPLKLEGGKVQRLDTPSGEFVEGHSQVRNKITHTEYVGDDSVRLTTGLFSDDLTCGIFLGERSGVYGL